MASLQMPGPRSRGGSRAVATLHAWTRFRVVGGARCAARCAVAGAKNSALKLMAAALLAAGHAPR